MPVVRSTTAGDWTGSLTCSPTGRPGRRPARRYSSGIEMWSPSSPVRRGDHFERGCARSCDAGNAPARRSMNRSKRCSYSVCCPASATSVRLGQRPRQCDDTGHARPKEETMQSNLAAIWARVSTHDQRELSPDTREMLVRRALEAEGYQVPSEYVLKVDWTSLDLLSCPDFVRLREWVLERRIAAIGVLDRDRLQAEGLQRLLFLAECREQGVRIITAQGLPIMDGEEGPVGG